MPRTAAAGRRLTRGPVGAHSNARHGKRGAEDPCSLCRVGACRETAPAPSCHCPATTRHARASGERRQAASAPLRRNTLSLQCRRAPADRASDTDGECALVPVALGLVKRRVALVKRARVVHFLVRVAVPVAARRRASQRRRSHYISRPAEIALHFAAPTVTRPGGLPVVRVAFAPVVRVPPPAPVLRVRHMRPNPVPSKNKKEAAKKTNVFCFFTR